jgi:SAM-dependent methyltransferase
LNPADYDAIWQHCDDFIRYNPGARHRRRLLLEFLRQISFQECLDVGCGNGEIPLLMKAEYPGLGKYVGVDLSPVAVQKNRSLVPNGEFQVLDIEQGVLPTRFELIICCEVIEHLENWDSAFENLSKMLKPGGFLIVSCPTGFLYATERAFGHTKHPTLGDLRRLAANHGLQVRKLTNWGWPFYRMTKWAANWNTEWSMKNFASGDYGVLAKFTSTFLYYVNFLNLRGAGGCQLFALMQKSGGGA